MNATPLSTIAAMCRGRLLAGSADTLIRDICTDSRKLKAGDLFVALKGEKFDGHDYIAQAAAAGAAGALVEKMPLGLNPAFGIIEVLDVLRSLQTMAAANRANLSLRVLGITGSNGKTSTKDFARAVLSRRFRTASTEGNLNNHIGVPLTLLSLDSTHEAAVVEMGMNHAGEIAPLAAMAMPQAAIITNIGIAHIEHLGSREAIAQEKADLAAAVPADGMVALNADDDFTPQIAARCRARVMTAGIARGDVRATDLQHTDEGVCFTIHASGQNVRASIPVPGEHMVRNALLACAVGLDWGLSLRECAEGLAALTLTQGRLQKRPAHGVTILDDSYNANPDSVVAGLRTLAALPASGRKIAVLGRMGELGHEAENGHRRVGENVAREGIQFLITVGREADWIADAARRAGALDVLHVEDTDAAAEALRGFVQPGDIVLVKGSRSSRMERVIQVFEEGGRH